MSGSSQLSGRGTTVWSGDSDASYKVGSACSGRGQSWGLSAGDLALIRNTSWCLSLFSCKPQQTVEGFLGSHLQKHKYNECGKMVIYAHFPKTFSS